MAVANPEEGKAKISPFQVSEAKASPLLSPESASVGMRSRHVYRVYDEECQPAHAQCGCQRVGRTRACVYSSARLDAVGC